MASSCAAYGAKRDNHHKVATASHYGHDLPCIAVITSVWDEMSGMSLPKTE